MNGHPPFNSRDSVRRVDNAEWPGYYKSAKEFMEKAQGALKKCNYNAAASNAALFWSKKCIVLKPTARILS